MVTRSGFVSRLLVAASFGTLCLCGVAAERRTDSADSGANLIRYNVPGGESIFALSLRAQSLKAQSLKTASAKDNSAPHDHVILFDTSASQAGAHRQQGLKVVEAFLASLNKSDRVQVFAVDMQSKPLSKGFFAPQAAETKAALGELQRRVPLGATSLQPGLAAALTALTGAAAKDRAQSIVYIGDGMSTGKLVDVQEFRTLVAELRTKHVPVSSFAVGPRTDLQVLGVLAQHTGGVVVVDALVDDARLTAEKLGQKLAAAADAPVFYPEAISLAPEADKLLPGPVPPLRSDRETIVLGKGRVGDVLNVTVSSELRSGEVGTGERGSLTWSVKPAAAQPGNTFLAGLWNMAEQSDGLLVAVAGSELLNEARQEYEGQVQELVAQGRQAVAKRDLKQAEQIARAVRQIDPANVEAEAILNASQKVKAVSVALARMQNEEQADPPQAGIAGDEVPATARDADLLDSERNNRAIRA
jgi:hypothetical protein